jgi:hypothetical protein
MSYTGILRAATVRRTRRRARHWFNSTPRHDLAWSFVGVGSLFVLMAGGTWVALGH